MNPHDASTGSAPPATILYRNYRGETAVRRIAPIRVYFGSSEWHPLPQWLLLAIDLDKQAERSFAMCDILTWHPPGA